MDEQGERITKVVETAEGNDILNALDAWSSYLKKHVQFPFNAKILSIHDQAPLYVDGPCKCKKYYISR